MELNRRDFLKKGIIGSGLILGTPALYAQSERSERPETNIADAQKIPKSKYSLPGLLPGKVVEVHDSKVLENDTVSSEIVSDMFKKGITQLTGSNPTDSFNMFFSNNGSTLKMWG